MVQTVLAGTRPETQLDSFHEPLSTIGGALHTKKKKVQQNTVNKNFSRKPNFYIKTERKTKKNSIFVLAIQYITVFNDYFLLD